MIAENDTVPVCREHETRIMRCAPCSKVLADYWEEMPKRETPPWNPEVEPASDYHFRQQKVAEYNQDRLHSWAKVHVYVDALEEVF
jgi:predicted adenine nucleotide alpha hydrolase (AANH) superfamily ATPase